MPDIKELATKLSDKLRDNPDLLSKLQSDPVSVIQSLIAVVLPEEQAQQVAQLVQANLTAEKFAGAAGKLKGLFGK